VGGCQLQHQRAAPAAVACCLAAAGVTLRSAAQAVGSAC
jgi:hypothetical protein